MKKIKLTILISTLLANFSAVVVHADKYGIDQTAGDAGLPKIADVPSALGNVLGVALSMVAVVFFVLMLYAGIRWMLARGNEEQEEKAKETIIGAVVGMVIIMLSYALTTFVFKGTTGGTITNTPSASDSSWDGSFCVMKDKPTVCTKINGDYANCASNIPPFSTAAECAAALKASAPGVQMSCKPVYSQDLWENMLSNQACKSSVIGSDNKDVDCKKVVTLDGGKEICFFDNPTLSCIINNGIVNLIDICKENSESKCDSFVYEYYDGKKNGSISSICKWE